MVLGMVGWFFLGAGRGLVRCGYSRSRRDSASAVSRGLIRRLWGGKSFKRFLFSSWLVLAALCFGLLNLLVSFAGARLFRLPGFDLVPSGVVLLAWRGESVLLAALLLAAGYLLPAPQRLRHLWMVFPATLLTGYLALLLPHALLLLLFYHAIGFVLALLSRALGPRYLLFFLVNFSLNLFVLRLASFF